MSNRLNEIEPLVVSMLENSGFSLIQLALRGHQHSHVLEIFIDSENDVSAETCAFLSRKISSELDRKSIIPGKYTLIVSSPGVDRPLKFPVQYKKNTGRKLQVTFREGDFTKRVHGRLTNCTDTGIQLDTDDNLLYSVPYDSIVEAKVSLPW